jgi:hypothetical protein
VVISRTSLSAGLKVDIKGSILPINALFGICIFISGILPGFPVKVNGAGIPGKT